MPHHADSTTPSRRTAALIGLAFFTAVGLLFAGSAHLNFLARGEVSPWRALLVEELTGAYSAGILLPAVAVLCARLPLRAGTWPRRLPLYALAAVAYSAAHTLLMAVSRAVLFPLLELGRFDYGILSYRFGMELAKDLFFLSVAVTILHLFARYREGRDRELRLSQMEGRLAMAQLHALRTQLQPHFLFNALNTISSTMYEDVRAADELLSRLAEMLRASMRGGGPQEVPLHEELAFLELYLELMRARFGERLRVEVEAGDDVRSARVPHLLLQPLVENAIRHGAADEGAAWITVHAHREGGALVLEVRDRGPGVAGPPEALLGRGIGLSNTAERLRHLYGDAGRLELANAAGGGLRVTATLPFREAAVEVGA